MTITCSGDKWDESGLPQPLPPTAARGAERGNEDQGSHAVGNPGLRDLRNQIYLMTEKREEAFQELGVGSLQSIFARAQKEFQKWEKRSPPTHARPHPPR